MTVRTRWTALFCGAVLAVAVLSGSVAAAEETEVSLEPADREVESGDVATYDVVVTDAQGGVGSFDLVVTVEDPSVASVANVSYVDEPAYTHEPQDEHSAQLAATGMDTPNGGSVHVATVTLEAENAGTTPISLAVSDAADESGRSYDVTGTTGASLSVPSQIGGGNDGDDSDGDSDEDGTDDENDDSDGSDDDSGDENDDSDGSDEDESSNDGDGDDETTPSDDGDGDDETNEGGSGPEQGASAPDDPSDGDGSSDGPSLAVVAILAAALVVLVLCAGLYLHDR